MGTKDGKKLLRNIFNILFLCYLAISNAYEDSCQFNFTKLDEYVDLAKTLNKTKFLLYNPGNLKKAYVFNMHSLNKSIIEESKFDPRKDIKMLIHGFNTNVNEHNGDFKFLKDVLLQKGSFNVLMLDWFALSGPNYDAVYPILSDVGVMVSRFICKLQLITGISPMSIHVIAQGTGAHLAGYIGALTPNLGRITGLDPPAHPFQDKGPNDRLDITDALHVDVIHTNANSRKLKGLGMLDPIGHFDFYPNGGHHQRGCTIDVTNGPTYENTNCNHRRAMVYFVNSITRPCCFLGEVCCGWNSVGNEQCYAPGPKRKIEMGYEITDFPTQKNSVRVCLVTSSLPPYCNEMWMKNGFEAAC